MNDAVYHQAILDTARRAFGAGRLACPDGEAEMDNPLCGDRVRLTVVVANGRLDQVAHEVRGCVLCEAAAALVAEFGPGLTVEEASTLAVAVRHMLVAAGATPPGWQELAMFTPVAARPGRHDCVLLPFETLCEALRTVNGRVAPTAPTD